MAGRRPGLKAAIAAIGSLPGPPLEAPLEGLDVLRRFGLRLLGPTSIARSILIDREKRVAVMGGALLVAAFFATSTLPIVMLALGPLVWGIPHILGDLRYLIARPGLHKRPLVLGAIGIGVLAAGLGLGVRGGLIGAALALFAAKTTWPRRLLGLAVAAALFGLAQRGPFLADIAFAHLHNLVAVLIWWAWRRRKTFLHLIPLGMFFLGCVALLLGAAEPLFTWSGGGEAPFTGLGMYELSWSLSPSPMDPFSSRLVVLYAFAQSAHYIVWLRLMPEDDRPSKTPRSYKQSFSALKKDLGGLLLWLSALGALFLMGWAFMGPGHARDGYLRLAFFHGHLELAAFALLWAEGRLHARPSLAPA